MKYSKKDYAQYLGGIILLTLGVAFSSKAGLGTGSLDSINFALAQRLNVNLSIIIMIMGGVAISISAIIRRKIPNFKTLITAIFMAIFTEFWVVVVDKMTVETLVQQVLVFILAITCASVGIAIYLRPKLPANPNDDITVSLHEVYGLKIGTAKLLIDIVAIMIALCLKGPIGVGTVLLTILIGPSVNVVNVFIDKLSFKTVDSVEKSII